MLRIISTLTILICATFLVQGQKIAVIEKNNYSSPNSTSDELNKNKYLLFIRELFYKVDTTWEATDNSLDIENDKPIKKKVEYMISDMNNLKSILGTRRKRELNYFLANELFFINPQPKINLTYYRENILRGFEHNDIVGYHIVQDRKIIRENILRIKDTLSEKQYWEVDSSYREKVMAFHKTTDTASCSWDLNYKTIRKEIEVLNNNFKLGKIELVPQNNCFTGTGSSYGGGNLYFVIFPNESIKFLRSNTELIDIADYDNDGKLEYLFFASWFNNYGYYLFYDNFSKICSNGWSYH